MPGYTMVRMYLCCTMTLASHAREHDICAAHVSPLQDQEHDSRLCDIK